jgi:hypothetical protein
MTEENFTDNELVIIEAIKQKFASGELVLDAPFPGMNTPWTKEEEDRLDETLKKIFGIVHDRRNV